MRVSRSALFCVSRAGAVALLALGLAACGERKEEAGGAAKADDTTPAEVRVYGVKSGRIDYEITGLQSGQSTTYWDDWGMREAENWEVTLTLGDRSVPVRRLSLRTREGLVLADLSANTATRAENPIFHFLKEEGLSGGEDLGQKWIESMGGVRDGTDTVAGQTCDVWVVESLGGKLCIWQGLMLRQEVQVEGSHFLKVAVAIDTDEKVGDDRFTLPDGLSFDAQPFSPAAPAGQ